MFRRFGLIFSRSSNLHSSLFHLQKSHLSKTSLSPQISRKPYSCHFTGTRQLLVCYYSRMCDAQNHNSPIPQLDKASKQELLRALESSLGSSFSANPIRPPANPLIIVISGPSGVGKDAVVKKLREARENLHFVVTATSRPMRPGEVDGEDYYFVSIDEFLSMVEKDELLEYALVYGDYKGIPKWQIRENMARRLRFGKGDL